MPEFAKTIEVRRVGGGQTLKIDGIDFPWAVLEDGITTEIKRTKSPTITITIPCDTLEVFDSMAQGEAWPKAVPHPDSGIARG